VKTSIDVNPEIWKRVRVLAATRNKSLREAVSDALEDWVARGRAELEGISEWVKRPMRTSEGETETGVAVRAVARETYWREHKEMSEARRRTTKRSRKKGKRNAR
jgi:predicted transcriptional regulator